MRIVDVLSTLKAERLLKKTPSGRPLTEYAVEAIEASLSDEKNWGSDAISCLNCCIICSSLLMPDGCVNCGGHDLTTDIKDEDIL